MVYIDAKDENEARTKLIQINVTAGRYTQSGFTELVRDIPNLDLTDFNYPDVDLEKIDLELKILNQAQSAIQTSDPFEGMFGDIDFGEQEDVDIPAPPASTPPEPPASTTSPQPIPSESPSVVGTASTSSAPEVTQEEIVEEDEPEEKELVVYCPECGESFVFKYTKEKGEQ